MSLRMMSGLPLRISQVLQDFLPAELDLIDAEEADGITTADVPAANFYQWDGRWIPETPACAIRMVSSTPIDVRTYLMGERMDASHRLDVIFHLTAGDIGPADGTSNPVTMQALLARYINGAMRVLCVRHEALDTTADPTRYVELVTWAEPATYGPDVEQEDGAVVRSATLPIAVRRREAR